MKNSKKRGFTIVELVIVIAVIAILAGVLIPTFVSVIKKGQEANDTALIKYLNTSLAAGTIGGKTPDTMQDALDIVEADGYNVAKIKATASGARILWDSKNNCFVYLKDGETEPTYIPDSKNVPSNNVDYWQITEADEDLSGKYSNYLALGYTKDLTNVQTGLDVGQNTGIAAITYKGTGSAQEVVLRTNSFDTVITVNAETDVVRHHGDAKEVNVAKVAPSSYHEYGTVSGNINLAYGKVELMNGSSVSNVVVKEIESVTPTTENVKVSVESGAKATLVISEVASVSVAVEGAGASTVAKVDDIAGKVAAIGSQTYATFEAAWAELKNDDTLVLLADCTMSSRQYVPANCNVVLDLNNHNITSTDRLFYVSNENSALEVRGTGKLTTSQQAVFGMVGSALDDGTYYKLTVGNNVETASAVYGVAIFSHDSVSRASYGVDVTFEGTDRSVDGVAFINGTVDKKVGNVPVIRINNATCSSGMYLAGFAKVYVTNSTFTLNQSLKIKSGEVHLSNNTISIDCTSANKQEADYVKNGNGAFGAKCGILIENGVPGYAGLTSITVDADNKITFINNTAKYSDVMYIDYTETASVDVNIGLRYIGIDEFSYRIAYSGTLYIGNEVGQCAGYIYFVDEAQAKAYTAEKFKEQYDLLEVKTYGTLEKLK